MSFVDVIAQLDLAKLQDLIDSRSASDVERALGQKALDEHGLAALLSVAARPHLEVMARRSATITRQRFGQTMQLYAPLYLANHCVNQCAYCGFAQGLDIERTSLLPAQVAAEAQLVHQQGFRHLLLVSGESPRHLDVDKLASVSASLGDLFSSVAIETAPFDLIGYERLARAGVDGLTLYQETYRPERYRQVHLAGPKRDYARRLRAIEDGGRAGFRTLGIGALLGLAPYRLEAFLLALHGRYLGHTFWRSRIAVSFPRIRSTSSGYSPPHPVTDADLVQMLCALRLFLPDAEMVLSTREPPQLRDCLMRLGITRMSAGSCTNPGGYGSPHGSAKQFESIDPRSADQVASAIRAAGLEPVWKDFDRAFAPDDCRRQRECHAD